MTAGYRPGDKVPSIYDRIHEAILPNGGLPSTFPWEAIMTGTLNGPTARWTASAAITSAWKRLV